MWRDGQKEARRSQFMLVRYTHSLEMCKKVAWCLFKGPGVELESLGRGEDENEQAFLCS